MPRPGEAEGNHGYYELRDAGVKGRGAFALKDIVAGTRILVDNALFTIRMPDAETSPGIAEVEQALASLSPAEQQHFRNLPVNPRKPVPSHLLDYARFSMNNFEIFDLHTRGCFAHVSRFNHSCLPNCTMSTTQTGQYQCYVHRDVRKNEELTFCYEPELLYMTTEQRDEHIRREMGVEKCACDHYAKPAKELLVSDMRRQMLRGLFCWFYGADLPSFEARGEERPQLSTSNVSEAQKCAAFARLLEAEGVVGSRDLQVQFLTAAQYLVEEFRRTGELVMSKQQLALISFWVARARWRKLLTVGYDVYRDELESGLEATSKDIRRFLEAGGDFRAMRRR